MMQAALHSQSRLYNLFLNHAYSIRKRPAFFIFFKHGLHINRKHLRPEITFTKAEENHPIFVDHSGN